jgi:hypothetical protein
MNTFMVNIGGFFLFDETRNKLQLTDFSNTTFQFYKSLSPSVVPSKIVSVRLKAKSVIAIFKVYVKLLNTSLP